MIRELPSMRLLEFIDNVVILAVVVQLLLELLDALLETFLRVEHLQAHVRDLRLVLLLDILLPILHFLLVLFELLLSLFLLLSVSLLGVSNHLLDLSPLLSLLQSILLSGHYCIRLSQYGLYLSLIGPS